MMSQLMILIAVMTSDLHILLIHNIITINNNLMTSDLHILLIHNIITINNNLMT
jgi:hypothetical protein